MRRVGIRSHFPSAFLSLHLWLTAICFVDPNRISYSDWYPDCDHPACSSPWKKERHMLLCRRAGATPRFTWAALGRTGGVAPARFGVFSTLALRFTALAISYASKKLLTPQDEGTREVEGGVCSSYPLHRSSTGAWWGAAIRRTTSVPKCAVTCLLLPPNSRAMSVSVTRPTFHPR